MSNIVPFQFGSFTIRTATDDHGEPVFVASDVCTALTLNDTSMAVSRLDDDEKGTSTIGTLGGSQEVLVVNESGLYSLILTSRKPEAKRFKKWVTSEVLPQIRKTGSYRAPGLDKPIYPAPAREFRSLFGVARLLGLDRNAAAISANQAVLAASGVNLLQVLGQTHLESETQVLYFTPTELGSRIGVSAKKFNLLLADVGLQAREGEHWVPSAVAADFCRVYDTGKKHGSGVPVTQVKWSDAVLKLVRPDELA